MRGLVMAVCTSDEKGVPKTRVERRITLLRKHGLLGDAHAGPWHRQVSLLALEDIDEMRQLGLDLEDGAFGENLVISGIELLRLDVGRRFRVGPSAVLQVTQHGKKCHTRCAIYDQAGHCIMPTRGIFACVVRSGSVGAGDVIRTDPTLEARIGSSDSNERSLTRSSTCQVYPSY